MTDENTRLPSDSVLEAAAQAIATEAIQFGDASLGDLPQEVWRWFAQAALAAQPRDDVRELEHDAILAACHAYEQSTKPAPFNQMKDAIEAYRTALSQGDEQPETQDDAFVCANCKGLLGELADGREPEELCETCYDHSQESTQPDTDGLAGELERIMRADPMDPDNLPASDETIELDWRLCDCILAALRNDRKAVLEEEVARQEAYERGWIDCTESMTEATHRDGLTEGFAQYQADLRALAEGAGK